MKEKITDNKQKIKLKQVKPVLSDPDVKKHQKELHRKIVIVTINKASNNFAFICRKYYISKQLAEGSPNKTKYSTSTYLEIQKNKQEIFKTNIKSCNKFDHKITEQNKALPIMYQLPCYKIE